MEFIMTLGERIKAERLKKDVSQAALAELCCVLQQVVGKWEKEIASPSLETLQILADYFGVTVDYLLCRDNKKTPPESGERKDVRIPVLGDTVDQVIKTYGHMYESDKQKIISEIG